MSKHEHSLSCLDNVGGKLVCKVTGESGPRSESVPSGAERHVGTCQVCFAQQITKSRRGGVAPVLVLHGYTRPGTGEIWGRCPGVGYPPFELSCERTKFFRDDRKERAKQLRTQLAKLESGQTKTLLISVPDKSRPHRYGERQPTRLVDIEPGWKGEDYGDTWERRLDEKKRETRRFIDDAVKYAAFLDEKIASWRYAPELLGKPEAKKESPTEIGRAWYYSAEAQALMRKLPAPARPGVPPGRSLHAWLEHQRPTMMWSTIRGATKPSYYDFARRMVAETQGLLAPEPLVKSRRVEKPPKPPKPISTKQAKLIQRLEAAGGEAVFSDWEDYYTTCDLKERKMASFDFVEDRPSPTGSRAFRARLLDEGRAGLARFLLAPPKSWKG